MNKFPQKIKIQVHNDDTGNPVSNIAAFITLFARKKNDYHFLLPISDKNGKIEITKGWLNNEIKKTIDFFVMDYSSSLEDCHSKFELKIIDKEAIDRVIKAMYLFKEALGIKQEKIDALSNVDNFKYIPVSQLIEIQGESISQVTIKIKEIQY